LTGGGDVVFSFLVLVFAPEADKFSGWFGLGLQPSKTRCKTDVVGVGKKNNKNRRKATQGKAWRGRWWLLKTFFYLTGKKPLFLELNKKPHEKLVR
jgi:hypothetical protein